MSYYAADRSEGGIRAADILSVLIIVAVAAAAAWYMIRDRDYPLQSSAMGHAGLIAWLRDQGLEAREARGLPITPEKVGLRVLPVHDTDLTRNFEAPTDKRSYLASGTEYDISAGTILRKINSLPSVIIAPKWSRAARHSGFADPSLLLPVADASRPFLQLNVMEEPLTRPDAKMLELSGPADQKGKAQAATLYAPQLFARTVPAGCISLLGGPLGHAVIECDGHKRSFIAVSDPDIFNNHGLSLGRNADIVANLIGEWSGGLPVLIDTTSEVFVKETPQRAARREWSDLLRLFDYPFSVLWAAAGVLMMLALWRSWLRFGPAVSVYDDRIGASKAVSIDAKARLLRMTGNDSALFETYITARIRQLEDALFGTSALAEDPVRRIFSLVERRNPDLARAFGTAAAAAQTPSPETSEAGLLELAETFERQTEQVLNEFGRSAQGG
ncbi:hypothetical protein [Halovulum sp. GXIMD14793]